jgi:hypothetical protein
VLLAAAVFVFTVAFMKDFLGGHPPASSWLIGVGWAAMVLSLLGGLVHMVGWDRYYISYRDYRNAAEGKKARRRINRWRRGAMVVQLAGFVVGMGAIAWFCMRNLDPVASTPPPLSGASHEAR